MEKKAQIAVLGCGHWGKNLVRNMAGIGALTALSDPTPATAKSYADQFRVRALSWDEILSDPSIDGVMIASPSYLHAEQAAQVLQSSKHVFVEKPLSLSGEDAKKLNTLATKQNRILMVGHLLHYHPTFLELLNQIQNGAIGTLRAIEARRLGRGPLRINDNVLWDLSSHDVSMVLRACQTAPDHIAATGFAIVETDEKSAAPLITDARIDLRFGKVHAHLHASWLAAEKEHKFIATGDKGALIFDDTKPWPEKLALHRYTLTKSSPRWNIDSAPPEYITVTEGEPLKKECQQFVDSIRTGQQPYTNGEEALRVVEIIETAQNKITEAQKMIPFIDLQAQRQRIAAKIDEAVLRVVHHGQYIMGPEIYELENALSEFCGAKHAISCANGTDAIALGLMAKGLCRGQAVLVPSFTFAATAEVVAWFDATPIFIDCNIDTMNIDPEELQSGMDTARSLGLKTVGIIPVDLFGLPADYDPILEFAQSNGLWVLSDTAQGFGGAYKSRITGSIGDMASTSFFPAKPLGCYGDGGAFFTDDDEIAEIVKSIRVHGQGTDKYDNVRIGMNGRMDTMQAAILIEKLKIFPDEIVKRNIVAARYNEGLKDVCITPQVPDGMTSTWAQYTIRITKDKRDAVAAKLKESDIPTAIYYPKPLHRQTAYKHYPAANGALPITDQLSREVLSLPMHPYLNEETQDKITQALQRAAV